MSTTSDNAKKALLYSAREELSKILHDLDNEKKLPSADEIKNYSQRLSELAERVESVSKCFELLDSSPL